MLEAEDIEKRGGRLRHQVEPQRLVIPSGQLTRAIGFVDARRAFAAQLDQLAEPERKLRLAHPLVVACAEHILDLKAHFRIGAQTGLHQSSLAEAHIVGNCGQGRAAQ